MVLTSFLKLSSMPASDRIVDAALVADREKFIVWKYNYDTTSWLYSTDNHEIARVVRTPIEISISYPNDMIISAYPNIAYDSDEDW